MTIPYNRTEPEAAVIEMVASGASPGPSAYRPRQSGAPLTRE